MSVGIAGMQQPDPMTFIVTLGGFIPAGFSILWSVCILLSLLMLITAGYRQMATARGRGEYTSANNLIYACFGIALALVAELIGGLGKGIFGEFESASVLLYVARDERNLSKVAVASFLFLIQFIGTVSVVMSIRVAARLGSNKPLHGETWATVFWMAFGGLCCVFIQPVIGYASAITGMPVARFINSL